MKTRFAPTLLEWYDTNKRLLPWRETRDPYRIWISEIILQQTRVAQGWAYFTRFTERFPTLESLACADEQEVLRLWQGLGYYSRARNLHAAAKQICERFGGRFPKTIEEVRSLPGIGDYTAAAICSFAYDQPTAVVDGNVYRVLSRLFGISTPIDSTLGKKTFALLADQLISHERPGDYNQAIMDFGATACTPKNPTCTDLYANCPFIGQCAAHRTGQIDQLPVKSKKNKIKTRYFHYLHLHCQDNTLLHKRTADDIWRHLYEYPMLETGQPLCAAELMQHPQIQNWFRDAGPITVRSVTQMPKHQLSHQCIHAVFFEWEIKKIPPEWTSDGINWLVVPESRLKDYPVSRLMEGYLAKTQNYQSSL